MKSATFQVYWR